MTSRERLLSAWRGRPVDFVPLTFWCFGNRPASRLQWQRSGRPVEFWYSKRMEHIHTLPIAWELEDDFQRVLAWQSLGVDDALEVSVPWSRDPAVRHQDGRQPAGEGRAGPLLVRDYSTPAGSLRHAVRLGVQSQGDGWVIQPDWPEVFEDLNLARTEQYIVSSVKDVARVRYLYRSPDAGARRWFAERMQKVSRFASKQQVPVTAWGAFGIDAAVWLCGIENAPRMAADHPREFGELMDAITETDVDRCTLAAGHDAVDMVLMRGWNSSTDQWAMPLLQKFLLPRIREIAEVVHRSGKLFAYVITNGVPSLGPHLADAGVDVLFFVDPAIDGVSLEAARDSLADRMTVVGGIHAISLASQDKGRIDEEVRRALAVLGPTHRFILHPVDVLLPDTPWEGVEQLIDAWKRYR